jgi:fibrillarin-like rRNA methylase
VSNPEAVKVLIHGGRKWAKPVESYRILRVYGENVLTTEGEEWRKHRKARSVCDPFGCSLYVLTKARSTRLDRRTRIL